MAAELADLLEKRGAPYAVLDLDWLAWFHTGTEGQGAPTDLGMLVRNLAPVVGNYLSIGIRFFVLAFAVRDRSELERLRRAVPMPLRVVRLTVPIAEIERRLHTDVTSGRRDDMREAASWMSTGEGEGVEDVALSNDRLIRAVAVDIFEWLGWCRDEHR